MHSSTTSIQADRAAEGRLDEYASFIRSLVDDGGPTEARDEEVYEVVNSVFRDLHNGRIDNDDIEFLRRQFDYTLADRSTLQGHAFVKPYGYPGDFELFDKMYTRHVSPDPDRCRWDEFFHRLDAVQAVRNRKEWVVRRMCDRASETQGFRALIVGSGPGRDVSEFLSLAPLDAEVQCIELDPRAIDFARKVCQSHLSRVHFQQGSILRYRTSQTFDLIWSGGLFDYFNDRVFQRALRHLHGMLRAQGELVVGNFSSPNRSQGFMELVSDWKLRLRTPDELTGLATSAALDHAKIAVDMEPAGVNLFLRIKKD